MSANKQGDVTDTAVNTTISTVVHTAPTSHHSRSHFAVNSWGEQEWAPILKGANDEAAAEIQKRRAEEDQAVIATLLENSQMEHVDIALVATSEQIRQNECLAPLLQSVGKAMQLLEQGRDERAPEQSEKLSEGRMLTDQPKVAQADESQSWGWSRDKAPLRQPKKLPGGRTLNQYQPQVAQAADGSIQYGFTRRVEVQPLLLGARSSSLSATSQLKPSAPAYVPGAVFSPPPLAPKQPQSHHSSHPRQSLSPYENHFSDPPPRVQARYGEPLLQQTEPELEAQPAREVVTAVIGYQGVASLAPGTFTRPSENHKLQVPLNPNPEIPYLTQTVNKEWIFLNRPEIESGVMGRCTWYRDLTHGFFYAELE